MHCRHFFTPGKVLTLLYKHAPCGLTNNRISLDMSNISRRRTRSYLLQALYARSMGGKGFDEAIFRQSFFDTKDWERLDMPYFETVFSGIIEKEGELLAIVQKYAPKFDIATMPVGNLLPIMIASYEMLYLTSDAIPEKVSINEAVELAKIFSDDMARTMVNGVLNALKEEK